MNLLQVYTVGPDYAHAEARKSPALDGKVERDKDGKEIRYPVLLSASEKMTARKVCMAFKVKEFKIQLHRKLIELIFHYENMPMQYTEIFHR